MDNFDVIDPKQIRSEKDGLISLIMRQLERFNYLSSIVCSSRTDHGDDSLDALVSGMKNALYSIENMLNHVQTPEYNKSVEGTKKALRDIELHRGIGEDTVRDYFELLFDWQRKMMPLFGEIGVVPPQEMDYYFEE